MPDQPEEPLQHKFESVDREVIRTAKAAGLDDDAARAVEWLSRPDWEATSVERLAAAIDPRYRALVLLAYGCRLRRSELRGLRRMDVDLVHRKLQVHEEVVDELL